MITRAALLLCIIAFLMSGCASTTSTANTQVSKGMSTSQVSNLLGKPDGREFRDNFEAWQYADVVGFGQCEYITIYFADEAVHSMTSIRGGSIAGCGLGSDPVDWSQVQSERQVKSDKPVAGPSTERDRYTDLERLKTLLDDGILTQEEFDREKAKILGD